MVTKASVKKEEFGSLPDGSRVDRYTLTNRHGVEVRISNYGATLVAMKTPDFFGNLQDITLGFESLAPYLDEHPYFGSLIGRYANRISEGKFQLNGKAYALSLNQGRHHLHGGARGFDKKLWTAEAATSANGQQVVMSLLSPDQDELYPGNLSVSVVFTLTDNNTLQMDYEATTDEDTIVNLTHHPYFNLACNGSIMEHQLFIHARHFLPVTEELIPTGQLQPVTGTPFDFLVSRKIGENLRVAHSQLSWGKGYDHTFVLDHPLGAMGPAARVYEPHSGRMLEVETTEPGLHLYTGNWLNGQLSGKEGRSYGPHSGFCLETQHFPDSPNQPHFPSTLLKKGERYKSSTRYRFSVHSPSQLHNEDAS